MCNPRDLRLIEIEPPTSNFKYCGHRLCVFQRACNQLYQLSVKGKQPAWVARYLDAGKPAELIEFSRRKEIRDDLPQVIRPDLVLTDEGYIVAGFESVLRNGGDIVISQEAATYRPEMEWTAARLNQRHAVARSGDSGSVCNS